MSSQHNEPQTPPVTQTPDERWLGLLARSGQTPATTVAASHAFLSKLKRVESTDAQPGQAGAVQPSSQLFARMVQAGASAEEASAEIETQSLAKALSQRRVKMEAQVPKADEALYARLQKRLSAT